MATVQAFSLAAAFPCSSACAASGGRASPNIGFAAETACRETNQKVTPNDKAVNERDSRILLVTDGFVEQITGGHSPCILSNMIFNVLLHILLRIRLKRPRAIFHPLLIHLGLPIVAVDNGVKRIHCVREQFEHILAVELAKVEGILRSGDYIPFWNLRKQSST